jgi:ketosteroid isomerase-like protein
MSDEYDNRAIVTSAYEALARGDDDAFIQHLADQVEWIVPGPADHPSTGRHVGKEALLLMFARFSAFAELLELEIERVVGDSEVVVVLGRERWKVKASGREFETIWANAVTVLDGLITRVTVYADTSNETAAFSGV